MQNYPSHDLQKIGETYLSLSDKKDRHKYLKHRHVITTEVFKGMF